MGLIQTVLSPVRVFGFIPAGTGLGPDYLLPPAPAPVTGAFVLHRIRFPTLASVVPDLDGFDLTGFVFPWDL